MNRAIIFIAVVVGLSACSAPAGSSGTPGMAEIAQYPALGVLGGDGQAGSVRKACDSGRAIYVAEGYQSTGIAVIDNAPECRPTQPSPEGGA